MEPVFSSTEMLITIFINSIMTNVFSAICKYSHPYKISFRHFKNRKECSLKTAIIHLKECLTKVILLSGWFCRSTQSKIFIWHKINWKIKTTKVITNIAFNSFPFFQKHSTMLYGNSHLDMHLESSYGMFAFQNVAAEWFSYPHTYISRPGDSEVQCLTMNFKYESISWLFLYKHE